MVIQNMSGNFSRTSGGPPAAAVNLPVKLAPAESRAPVEAPPVRAAQATEGERLKQAADMINKTIQSFARNLNFSVDEDTGKTVVKVVDMETGDVIRQVPSEEALAIAKALDSLQGLIIRQKA